MIKTKAENGITLIALIITIVVLLILAVVAVNEIITDGILEHASNSTNQYNQSVEKESKYLQNYTDIINNKIDNLSNDITPAEFNKKITDSYDVTQAKRYYSHERETIISFINGINSTYPKHQIVMTHNGSLASSSDYIYLHAEYNERGYINEIIFSYYDGDPA